MHLLLSSYGWNLNKIYLKTNSVWVGVFPSNNVITLDIGKVIHSYSRFLLEEWIRALSHWRFRNTRPRIELTANVSLLYLLYMLISFTAFRSNKPNSRLSSLKSILYRLSKTCITRRKLATSRSRKRSEPYRFELARKLLVW